MSVVWLHMLEIRTPVRAAGVSDTWIVASAAKTIHRSSTKTFLAARWGYLVNRADLSLVEPRSSEQIEAMRVP